MKNSWLASAVWLFTPISARAEAPARTEATPEPKPLSVVLDYGAPRGCPEAEAFREQVRGRTQRLLFVSESDEADQTWQVIVTETSSGARGRLRVSSREPGRLERQVAAGDCVQVVNALSLVAALSVDPDASLTPREAAPAPKPTVTAPETPRVAPSPSSPPPRPRPSRAQLRVGLLLNARSGLGSSLSWAPRAFVGVGFRSARGYEWGLVLSGMQSHGRASVDVGQADLSLSLARLEAFPVRLELARLRLEPALWLEAGQLRARGVGVAPTSEVRRPALFVGALARASWLAFDFLSFQLEAGPALALARDRFYLFENTTVFRIAPVTVFAAAGLGLNFW